MVRNFILLQTSSTYTHNQLLKAEKTLVKFSVRLNF